MRKHAVLAAVLIFAATHALAQEAPYLPPPGGPYDSEVWNTQRQNDTEFYNAQKQENPGLREYEQQKAQERQSQQSLDPYAHSDHDTYNGTGGAGAASQDPFANPDDPH